MPLCPPRFKAVWKWDRDNTYLLAKEIECLVQRLHAELPKGYRAFAHSAGRSIEIRTHEYTLLYVDFIEAEDCGIVPTLERILTAVKENIYYEKNDRTIRCERYPTLVRLGFL